uniref:EGF-like domain-containing protein n=1 Tax=Plectus sambesii TaxID=2011161 RepID=A0A914WSP7_9BILA
MRIYLLFIELSACYSAPCKNGAQCSGFDSFTCQCANGFEGRDCGIKSCPSNPCLNGGTCSDLGSSFVCICPMLTSGTLCEERLPTCSSNPCQYGGTCTGDLDSYQCRCRSGITGINCETNIDDCASVVCQNGGSCVDEIEQYYCKCMVGFLGSFCETDIDECASTPCNNRDSGATCLDLAGRFKCVCAMNYTGNTCTFDPGSVAAAAELIAPGAPLEKISELSKSNNTVGTGALLADAVPFLAANMAEEMRKNMSWGYADAFQWVTYEENELNIPEKFVMWNDPLLGNCFTFNHMNKTERFTLHRIGAKYGIRARLKLNLREYVSWSTTAGYRIFIHDPNEAVFMESISFEASPGYLTSIAVKKSIVKRLKNPYGECTMSDGENTDYFFEGVYTKEGCIRTCYQKELKKQCGCMDPRYKTSSDDQLCGIDKRTCIEEFNAKNSDYQKWSGCVCNTPCSITNFDASLCRTSFRNQPSECNNTNSTVADKCLENYEKETVMMEVYF